MQHQETHMKQHDGRKSHTTESHRLTRGAIAMLLAWHLPMLAHAVELETGNTALKIQFDTTLKYSAGYRLKDASATLLADPNQDDGDRSFSKGLISNRVDLLSEFDVKYQDNMGLRVSGAAWYDAVYRRSNDNSSPATVNAVSVPYNQFNARTRSLHGGTGEVLDAFVYVNGTLGDVSSTLRLGRHTLLYGESLFFGNNGIAGGQAPVDIIKLLSVPNSQFKEIVRPVNQVSAQFQIMDNLALGGYYQFEWRKTLIPSAGSYFAAADVLEGSERFLLPAPPGAALYRTNDENPSDHGQGGLQLRWRPKAVDVEVGLYAIQYHDKTPQFYATSFLAGGGLDPAIGRYGDFRMVFAEKIKSYGVSFSTQFGDFNVAGEASVRRDTPLVSDPTIFGVTTSASGGDNRRNPAYAVGNSAHLQLSTVYIVPRSSMWDTANFLGEIAWNRRTSISRNPAAVAANSARDAWAMRLLFEPSWYQVIPGLDLSVPFGLGYSPKGNSSVVSQFNPGGKNGGDVSIGIKGSYQQLWKFGLTYTGFFGDEGTALTPLAQFSFKQTLRDRNFLALTAQRSF
jgi:hypothetical protein